MTQVTIKNEDGIWGIHISGHAENPYPDTQGNLLCASISILAYTLMQTVRDLEADGGLKRYSEVCKDGEVQVIAEPEYWSESQLEAKIEVIKTGYELLERQFPGMIRVGGEMKNKTV